MENEMKDEFFVVKPKPPREDATIEEVKPESIPVKAIEELNQPSFELPEEIEELPQPTKTVDELEDMEEIEIIPNGYSGMYILVTILMVAMIGISVLGFILS